MAIVFLLKLTFKTHLNAPIVTIMHFRINRINVNDILSLCCPTFSTGTHLLSELEVFSEELFPDFLSVYSSLYGLFFIWLLLGRKLEVSFRKKRKAKCFLKRCFI